jgi:6-phosphogluconolactonase
MGSRIGLSLLILFLGQCGSSESAKSGEPGISNLLPPPTATHLFITSFQHNTAGTLFVFRKSATACDLSQVSTHGLGTNPFDLTYDQRGFLYVANEGSATVSVFQFNRHTGVLTALGSPVSQAGPATTMPYGIAIHSSGWVYVVDGQNPGSIGYFQQNQTTGALTQLSAPSHLAFGAGNRVWFPAIFGSRNHLYATMYDAGRVNLYEVNTGTGVLTAHATPFVAAGTNPWEIVFHPTGNFIYVANYGSANISQYSVNSSTGLIAAIGPATVAAGTNPISLAVGTNYLYAGSFNGGGAGAVYGYSINQSTGALTATAQGNLPTGTPGVYGMALDKDAACLYVARSDYNGTNDGEDVRIFSVNQSTGALTAAGSVAAGAGPRFIKVAY